MSEIIKETQVNTSKLMYLTQGNHYESAHTSSVTPVNAVTRTKSLRYHLYQILAASGGALLSGCRLGLIEPTFLTIAATTINEMRSDEMSLQDYLDTFTRMHLLTVECRR